MTQNYTAYGQDPLKKDQNYSTGSNQPVSGAPNQSSQTSLQGAVDANSAVRNDGSNSSGGASASTAQSTSGGSNKGYLRDVAFSASQSTDVSDHTSYGSFKPVQADYVQQQKTNWFVVGGAVVGFVLFALVLHKKGVF